MFEDEELRAVFRAECEERLQNLGQGLLGLESNPQDAALLENVFRDAHNLKGTARMVGAADLGTLAHRFEDLLGDARRGALVLTSQHVDRLSRALDSMERLVREAITGEPARVDLPAVLALLNGEPAPAAAASPAPEAPADLETVPAALVPAAAPEAPAILAAPETTAPSSFKIETIRVEPPKLDALMMIVGELTVTKGRVARRLRELEEIVALHEEWSRDATAFAPASRASGRRTGLGLAERQPETRSRERLEAFGKLLDRVKTGIYEDSARLNFVADQLEEGIRTIRLLPLSTMFNLFPRMIRDLSRDQGKEVIFTVEGGDIAADKRIIEEMKDPLMHILRNAVDHGIEHQDERERLGKPRSASLRLKAHRTSTTVLIEVQDDGRGLDLEAIKETARKRGIRREEDLAAMTPEEIQALIFAPGFSTRSVVTDVSGRGVGLDVVWQNVSHLKGSIQVQSVPGQGCRMRVRLPITLATTRVLIVAAAGQAFAVPVEHVESVRLLAPDQIFKMKSSDTVVIEGRPVSIARLSQLLSLPGQEEPAAGERSRPQFPCVVLTVAGERLGIVVDSLIDEQEVVQKPLGSMLRRVPNVAGATILGTGDVCILLNAQDLMTTARRRLGELGIVREGTEERKRVVLLVEDSITTRTQEKRILEGAGYAVVTAVDGIDGLEKLRSGAFDAVVTDIEMPNLDGLALTERIRSDERYKALPIILVTSLASDESRRKGAEAGADAYITKSMFDQRELVEALGRLV